MLVFEFKTYGKSSQFAAVDEAIRTAQFVRNSCLRYWIDNPKSNRYDLNKYCAVLAASLIEYGRAYRNFGARSEQRFRRIDLYFGWRNPVKASWLVD